MVILDIKHTGDVFTEHHDFCGVTTAVGYAVASGHMLAGDKAVVMDVPSGAVYELVRIK